MKKVIVLVLCLVCALPVMATDLFKMVEIGNIEGVRQAILEGADTNAVDADGMTALTFAVKSKFDNPDQGNEILELLLKAGADINHKIEYSDSENVSLLSLSIMAEIDYIGTIADNLNSRYDVATWLIQHGAEVNVRMEGIPMFYAPVITGSPEILELMISSGLNMTARSEEGYTALSFLLGEYENISAGFHITEGHYEALKLLIKAGLDVNAWDEDGMNALLYAAKSCDADMIRFLLESGADAKLISPHGETAFRYAESNGALKYTDEYWLLCDAHYEAMDNHIKTMQPFIVLNY